MIQCKNASFPNPDAKFLGWQETLSGKAIALYNITAENHPSFGSTVTDRILHALKLKIPKKRRYRGKKNNLDIQENINQEVV